MRHMRNKHRDILYSIISDEKPQTRSKKTAPTATLVHNNTSTADADNDDDEVVQEFEIIELKSERFADDYQTVAIKPDMDVVAELIKPLCTFYPFCYGFLNLIYCFLFLRSRC